MNTRETKSDQICGWNDSRRFRQVFDLSLDSQTDHLDLQKTTSRVPHLCELQFTFQGINPVLQRTENVERAANESTSKPMISKIKGT